MRVEGGIASGASLAAGKVVPWMAAAAVGSGCVESAHRVCAVGREPTGYHAVPEIWGTLCHLQETINRLRKSGKGEHTAVSINFVFSKQLQELRGQVKVLAESNMIPSLPQTVKADRIKS